jgi:hypothetical protein
MEPMKFSETTTAKTYIDWKKQTLETIKFLIQNQDIILNEQQRQMIYTQRSTILTPISMIFSHLVDSKVIDNIFCPIVIESKAVKGALPEILANPNFIMNLEEVDSSDILSGFPHIHNKVIVNLTPWIQIKGDLYKVIDTNMIHGLFVKGALCRSFYQTKSKWLTPTLVNFIAKSYSMVISNIIATSFNLDITYEKFSRLLFATYILQKLNNEPYIPPSGLNQLGAIIGTQSDIEAIIADVFQGKAFGLVFSDVVKLLHEKIATRIPSFSEFNLVRMCASLIGDVTTSYISLEYPPYWVYGLLLAASYGKNVMQLRLKQMKLDLENKMFTDSLNRSLQFIEELK